MQKKQKKQSKPARKSAVAGQMPRSSSVVSFWRFANWAELWEKWYLTLNDNGTYKFRTIKEFAKTVTPTKEQQLFMEWYLGPKKYPVWSDDSLHEKYKFVGHGSQPQDWRSKRENHGWYDREALKQLGRTITSKQNALDKMASAGDEVTLATFTTSSILLERLDAEFGGRFFVDGLTMDQNFARAKHYLGLRSKIIAQLDQTQRLYALAHGCNYEDMQGFSQILATSLNISVKTQQETGVEKVMRDLVTMTLAKAAKHSLPLPADMDEKIIDVMAEKDKVQ